MNRKETLLKFLSFYARHGETHQGVLDALKAIAEGGTLPRKIKGIPDPDNVFRAANIWEVVKRVPGTHTEEHRYMPVDEEMRMLIRAATINVDGTITFSGSVSK